ncbi:hypothetical protein DPMN_044934 [Dreissena polymorpha]|uniref:Uncharacterized protein n=1 Tax=Dreissena polymorpha TaxID=45954 RepID=A0A9D4D359_DREPO|nr:hypothetical protein DPMN_044934 [Dreissena polymorpha]
MAFLSIVCVVPATTATTSGTTDVTSPILVVSVTLPICDHCSRLGHHGCDVRVPGPATTVATSGTTVVTSPISVVSITLPVPAITSATSGTTVVISVTGQDVVVEGLVVDALLPADAT